MKTTKIQISNYITHNLLFFYYLIMLPFWFLKKKHLIEIFCFILFFFIFFSLIDFNIFNDFLYLDTPKTQKVYSIYYKTEIELPITEKINIHNTDLPTFLKYKFNKYYGIFKEYFDYYYEIVKNYIKSLPYFNEVYSGCSTAFYFCYKYIYVILKKITIFTIAKATALHNFIITYYEKLKSTFPPFGIYGQIIPASKQYPECVIIRVIVSRTYGFDFYNAPYCPRQHFFSLYGYNIELKFNGTSLYLFDWIDIKRAYNVIAGTYYLKYYIAVFKKDLVCTSYYYFCLGIIESFEQYEDGVSRLNIFKLLFNGNYLYGCLGFAYYFTIHAFFLELFFTFVERFVITMHYWIWRLVGIFGGKLARHKAKLVVRGYDIVQLEEEAKIAIATHSQEVFDTFKAFETVLYHKAKIDPDEVLLIIKFFDVEFRYRTLETMLDSFHLLAEELDPHRRRTFTEENMELLKENESVLFVLESTYPQFKQRTKTYDVAAANSISEKVKREHKKRREFVAFNANRYFKYNNVANHFTQEHIDVLTQIYKEQLTKEFEEEKYKNLKKKK